MHDEGEFALQATLLIIHEPTWKRLLLKKNLTWVYYRLIVQTKVTQISNKSSSKLGSEDVYLDNVFKITN